MFEKHTGGHRVQFSVLSHSIPFMLPEDHYHNKASQMPLSGAGLIVPAMLLAIFQRSKHLGISCCSLWACDGISASCLKCQSTVHTSHQPKWPQWSPSHSIWINVSHKILVKAQVSYITDVRCVLRQNGKLPAVAAVKLHSLLLTVGCSGERWIELASFQCWSVGIPSPPAVQRVLLGTVLLNLDLLVVEVGIQLCTSLGS